MFVPRKSPRCGDELVVGLRQTMISPTFGLFDHLSPGLDYLSVQSFPVPKLWIRCFHSVMCSH